VAEGAENKVTEYRIRKAVTNLFNIPDNKVNVYPMKK
jgi:stage III sporulation protein AG